MFAEPLGSLLKGGCIDVQVDLGGLKVAVPHGVGQDRKQCVEIFLRLPPPCNARTGIVVTKVVQARRRWTVEAATGTQAAEDAVGPVP